VTPIFANGTGVVTPGNVSVTNGAAISTGTLNTTTTYTLTVTDSDGDTAVQTLTVTVSQHLQRASGTAPYLLSSPMELTSISSPAIP